MLFDDLNLSTIIHENELYVNVEQLYKHLAGSTQEFSHEAYEMAQKTGITEEERIFINGLIQGMWSIVMMLNHGDQEFKFESVKTVDDLVEKFWNENRTDN
jgi:hypothetical protein